MRPFPPRILLVCFVVYGCSNLDALMSGAPKAGTDAAADASAPADGHAPEAGLSPSADAGDAGDAGDARSVSDASILDAAFDVTAEGGALACPAGAFFCDDFEMETASFERWMSQPRSDVTLTIGSPTTGGYVYRGNSSLHTHANAQPADSGISSVWGYVENPFGPLTSGTFGLRVYVYLPSMPTDATQLMFLGPTTGQVAYVHASGAGVWAMESNGEAVDNVSTVPIALQTWICVQWTVTIVDGMTTHNALVVDGAPIFQDLVLTNPASDGYGRLGLGFIYASDLSVPQDAYFDDLAFGGGTIDCE